MKVSTKHVRHTTAHHATVLSVSRATINPPYRKNIGVLNPSMPRANISTSLERSYNPASFHNPIGRHFADVRYHRGTNGWPKIVSTLAAYQPSRACSLKYRSTIHINTCKWAN